MRTHSSSHYPHVGHDDFLGPMSLLFLQGLFLVVMTIALYAYAASL